MATTIQQVRLLMKTRHFSSLIVSLAMAGSLSGGKVFAVEAGWTPHETTNLDTDVWNFEVQIS